MSEMTAAERAAVTAWLDREQAAIDADAEWREARWAEKDADAAVAEVAAAVRRQHDEAVKVASRANRLAVSAEERARQSVVRSGMPELSDPERVAEEASALAAARRADEWRQIARSAEARASVIGEPEIYGPNSPHSFFRDVVAFRTAAAPGHDEARERLEKYGKALARDGGKVGWRARRTWREASRRADPALSEQRSRDEFRAMSTGSASGGALVTPAYLVEDYALYRTADPTVTEQLSTARPLPDFGMEVNVPAFTGPADMGVLAENTAPTEVDPTGAYRSIPVAMHVGLVNASQALHDRSGPTGFDSAIYGQLRNQLDADVDSAVITAMLTAPNTVTRTITSALTLPMFLSDVGQASAKLQTTAGTRMAPSGLAAAGTIAEWLLAQVTSNGDPWFRPSLGVMRQGGVTGQAISGIGFLIDDNLPAASGNAQLVLAAKAATFTYSGEPIFDVLQVGGLAGSLTVTYRLRQYAAPLVRYPNGVTVVSGTGYPASPAWA